MFTTTRRKKPTRSSSERRVYYTGEGPGRRTRRALGLALVAMALEMSPAAADTDKFTIDPVMTRGPADAPVTIVEFSDYQ